MIEYLLNPLLPMGIFSIIAAAVWMIAAALARKDHE